MDKYETLNTLGEGAFGVVVKCRDKETNEVVAVKKFKEADNTEESDMLILREVKALKALAGEEDIVQLKEAFKRQSKMHLVFEYLPHNLLHVLEKHHNGLPADRVRLYIYRMVKALKACHDRSIVHRDVKPENLLVGEDPEVLKLCDFGCARKLKEQLALTDYIATRWYRAPELFLGTRHYTTAVDIWAVGCIMAECSDGRPLFPCRTEGDGLAMIHNAVGLTVTQLDSLHKQARFKSVKLGVPNIRFFNERFHGILTPEGLSFMKAVLQTDPSERPTAAQCLQHEYLKGLEPAPAPPPLDIAITQEGVDVEADKKKKKRKRKRKGGSTPTTVSSAPSTPFKEQIPAPPQPLSAATPPEEDDDGREVLPRFVRPILTDNEEDTLPAGAFPPLPHSITALPPVRAPQPQDGELAYPVHPPATGTPTKKKRNRRKQAPEPLPAPAFGGKNGKALLPALR